MPRKPTHAELTAELERAKSSLFAHSEFLCLQANGTADAVETVRQGEWTYRYSLWGATRAHGGLLVIVSRCKGQSASVDVTRIDEWTIPMGQDYLPHRNAVERLRTHRNGACAMPEDADAGDGEWS